MNETDRSILTRIRQAVLLSALCLALTQAHASPDWRTLFPFHERYVAIDNACAWPALTKLPNGDLSVLIWPLPNHGTKPGAAETWLSDDDGRSWRKSGVPVPNDPKMNRMNVAAGLTGDGRYIAIVSGWTLKPNPATDIHKGTVYGTLLSPVCAISSDGGKKWQQYPEVPMTNQLLVPFGRVAALQNGDLGVMFYGLGVGFYTSSDHGATWKLRGRLTADRPADTKASKNTETTWITLKNGNLYAASRTRGDGERLAGYRSTDNGATWTFEEYLSLAGQAPADLTELPDGKILLTYGVRNAGGYGIAVRFADPAATRWSTPLTLVDLETTNRDLGYPSTVVGKDNTLVTAYYTKGVEAHNRYHMGIVRWKPPGKAPGK